MNCEEFRELAKRSRSGDLSTDEQSQWEEHMLQCESCLDYLAGLSGGELSLTEGESSRLTGSVMQSTLGRQEEVDRMLLVLQSAKTPPGFTREVMELTAGHQLKPWQEFLRHLLLRPRFAQEFSFVVTLCWVLIFGVPNDFISAENFQNWLIQIEDTFNPGG